MEIERIREFIVLAEKCSYTSASDALYISSPTLSKHIIAIEKELGATLFQRTSRSVMLTPAGTLFLENAKQLVTLYDQTILAVGNISRRGENSLTIACLDVMRQYHILDQIFAFQQLYPEIGIHMLESDGDTLEKLLRMQACDFAFASRLDMFNTDVARIPFRADELALLVPSEHRLAARESVSLTELENETFVLHNSYYEFGKFVQKCSEHHFQPNVLFSSQNSGTVIDFVANGKGISVLSRARWQMEAEHNRKVIALRLEPAITFQVHLFYLDTRTFTPAMHAFRQFIYTAEKND